jgi:site-specific recombinase XerD
LIDYLRGLGVVAPQPPVRAASAAEQLLADYAGYLVAERGLAAASLRSYVGVARRFLDEVAVGGALDLAGMNAAAVTPFVQRECGRLGVASAKVTVRGVRSLLRFLYLDGRIATPLSATVPAAAGWQLAGLPRAITAAELTRLLDGSNRGGVGGRRDFAILTVLARLGLRAGEVAALRLGDIDWRNGEIMVRGKGQRREPMPLPVDVGQALTGWLCQGRRADAGGGAVFTSLRAPYRSLSVGGVSAVVRRACRRAGITPVGAHRLRHTAATGLLRAGADLAEVGQVLRHRRLATTAVYAKVDASSLSMLAQPWPGGQS